MYYCFIREEIATIDSKDPLVIQANYAKHINKFCCCSLKDRKVTDACDKLIVLGEEVCLRATCDNVMEALAILQENNIKPIETPSEIEKIQLWEELNLTHREVVSVRYRELISQNFSKRTREFLEKHKYVFLKSRIKGISVKIQSEKVLNADEKFVEILNKAKKTISDEFLISPILKIESDSLGEKEARFFVHGNKIINCSRNVHTVKHTVVAPFLKKAQEIIDIIGEKDVFPENYVLDIAKFNDGSQTYFDVVEINPISTALCYVNNSIFTECCDDIEGIYREYQFGYEYCYDFRMSSNVYHKERLSNYNYSYITDGRYDFLEENQ